ncbi:MAG: hypothetical protein ACEY3E_03530, partial [Candidatus Tisiphia sp.]
YKVRMFKLIYSMKIKNCVVIIQDSRGARRTIVRLAPRLGNSHYYHDFDSIVYQLFIYEQYIYNKYQVCKN